MNYYIINDVYGVEHFINLNYVHYINASKNLDPDDYEFKKDDAPSVYRLQLSVDNAHGSMLTIMVSETVLNNFRTALKKLSCFSEN